MSENITADQKQTEPLKNYERADSLGFQPLLESAGRKYLEVAFTPNPDEFAQTLNEHGQFSKQDTIQLQTVCQPSIAEINNDLLEHLEQSQPQTSSEIEQSIHKYFHNSERFNSFLREALTEVERKFGAEAEPDANRKSIRQLQLKVVVNALTRQFGLNASQPFTFKIDSSRIIDQSQATDEYRSSETKQDLIEELWQRVEEIRVNRQAAKPKEQGSQAEPPPNSLTAKLTALITRTLTAEAERETPAAEETGPDPLTKQELEGLIDIMIDGHIKLYLFQSYFHVYQRLFDSLKSMHGQFERQQHKEAIDLEAATMVAFVREHGDKPDSLLKHLREEFAYQTLFELIIPTDERPLNPETARIQTGGDIFPFIALELNLDQTWQEVLRVYEIARNEDGNIIRAAAIAQNLNPDTEAMLKQLDREQLWNWMSSYQTELS